MSRNEGLLDRILDRAIDSIRDERVDDSVLEQASDRVWSQLRSELESTERADPDHVPIRTCDDFRSLVEPYLAGRLSDSRRLLLEDHVRECIPCRRALKEGRAARVSAELPAASRPAWVSAAVRGHLPQALSLDGAHEHAGVTGRRRRVGDPASVR